MTKPDCLHVGITDLPPLRVSHKLCIFRADPGNPDRAIRKAFQALREWVVGFGLDPDILLHVGIPTLDKQDLTTYDCCVEFPLPIDEEAVDVQQKSLSGGTYAVLRIEKTPRKIAKSIREFQGDYMPEHGIIVDESRPVYEIYYKDTMEYCVPIIV